MIADDLPAGRTVEWHWLTWDGFYSTNPTAETVEYIRRSFTEKRVELGRSAVDDQGTASATFVAPEDYGEVHLIYAVVDGGGCGPRRFPDPALGVDLSDGGGYRDADHDQRDGDGCLNLLRQYAGCAMG